MPEGTTNARVTLSDVAERAGVSQAAVSLALRGRPGIADATRQRIESIADELGYRARASDTTSGTIGVLIKTRPEDLEGTNAFYGPVVGGISAAASDHGLDVRLDSLLVDDNYQPIETPRLARAAGLDGMLVLGAYLTDASIASLPELPLVLVDGYCETPNAHPLVVSDNFDGTRRATQHLIDLGHRSILLVGTSPTAFPSIAERRAGYVSALAAAQLQPAFVDGYHGEPEIVAAATLEFLEKRPDITGIVAANDAVALAILGEMPLRVPTEISIIGFDDIEAARMVRPRLDTIAIDKPAMGRLAVSTLLHRARYPSDPAFVTTQQAQLVHRDTTAPPPP